MANSVRLLGFKQIKELFSKGFKLYKHTVCVIMLQISIFTKGASISWRHFIIKFWSQKEAGTSHFTSKYLIYYFTL